MHSIYGIYHDDEGLIAVCEALKPNTTLAKLS